MGQVSLAATLEYPDRARAGIGRRRIVERSLDLVLEVVGELHPVAGEELDAVVLGRVVGSGDHDAGVGAELGGEERNRRRGLDAGE